MTINQESIEIQINQFLEKIVKNDILKLNSSDNGKSSLFAEPLGDVPALKVMHDHAYFHCFHFSCSQFLVEGYLMTCIGCCGIFLNAIATCFFIKQGSQRPFHR